MTMADAKPKGWRLLNERTEKLDSVEKRGTECYHSMIKYSVSEVKCKR